MGIATPVTPGSSPATTSQLRAAIDAGQTRDKVNYPDPAAAPLGTDDEAGGSSPTADQVRLERVDALPAQERRLDFILYLILVIGFGAAMIAVVALSR